MKKQNKNLHFNYDIDSYKSGMAYKLDHLSDTEIQRLLRRGCIYAGKDAKYYQEEKPVVVKPMAVKPVKATDEVKPIVTVENKDVKKDVNIQNNEQTKVQAKPTNTNKSNK